MKTVSPRILPRQVWSALAALTACLALAACVAGGPNKQSNLGSVLSPTEIEQSNAAAEADATPDASAKPAATTALADPAAPQTAAQKASAAAANGTPKANSTPTKPEAAAKKSASVARPKADIKPPQKGVLDSLFASNEAGKTAKKPTSKSNIVKRPKKSVATTKKKGPRKKKGSTKNLPGVRSNSTLFGILGSGEKNHDLDEPVEVASVTARARRGNFGLLLQTKNVRVNCFPAKLVRILKKVERKFGRTPIVTSGYRSRAKNRRIRGARNSTHISCKAADIQIKGVSKWKVAKYLRSIPGRGGVGTYCHTKSVHIDIGVKRDWNWRCRRKRRR